MKISMIETRGEGGTQQSFIRGGEALLRGLTALTAVNALSLKWECIT